MYATYKHTVFYHKCDGKYLFYVCLLQSKILKCIHELLLTFIAYMEMKLLILLVE